MMILGAILPIFLVLLFGLFFFITVKIGKKYLTIKITHWLLLIYVGVLVLSSIAVPLFAQENDQIESMNQRDSENGVFDPYSELLSKLSEGEVDEIAPSYLQDEMSFDYPNDTIRIVPNTNNGPQIFVERKEKGSSKIEVEIYSTGLVVDGLDYSSMLKPPQIDLTENILTVNPIYQEFNFAIASNGYPIRQFTRESMFKHQSVRSGDSFVYLRIPSDIEIEGNVDSLRLID
jgi:ABC-type transport system involved in multi-copper enzyme maturation permease subunit